MSIAAWKSHADTRNPGCKSPQCRLPCTNPLRSSRESSKSLSFTPVRGSSGDFRSKRMTKILLIRHGHVEGIKPERFRGREPLELTAQGRAEAVAAANRIAGRWRPRTIYTSPMGRCVKTAEAVAKICAVAVQTCNDLNDLDYGAWQFKTFQQAKAEDPMLFAAWFATPTWSAFREANHCRTLPPEPPTLRG